MKRFTETDKWADAWFTELSAEQKLLWLYLLDICDPAGVIDYSQRRANFDIGTDAPIDELVEIAGSDRIRRMDCGKFWLVKFCEFQYPGGVSGSKMHSRVRSSIMKHRLPVRINNEYPFDTHSIPIQCPFDTHSIPNGDPLNDSQDKDKDKVQDKDTETTLPEIVDGGPYDGLPTKLAEYAEKIDSLSESWARSPKEWMENNALQQRIFGRLGSLADVQSDDWRTLRWFYLQAESDPDVKVTHKRLNMVDDINSHISRARAAWTAAGKPSLSNIKRAAA